VPTVTQVYHVLPGAPVSLDVQIGDAQAGGHGVFLAGQLKAQGELVLKDVALGTGETLVGKVLVVSSVAVDIQPAHDHVSVQAVLRGGFPSPHTIVQAADAEPNGNVGFLTVVTFSGSDQ
jgi:hypothetical protein